MKEALRTCIGCGSKRPKRELLRIRVDSEGMIRVSSGRINEKYPGRGIYICASRDCIDSVKKKDRISRVLKTEVKPDIYLEMKKISSGGE